MQNVQVPQCHHKELIPERHPVYLVIEKADRGVGAVGNGRANHFHSPAICARALQEPKHLLAGIPCKLMEAWGGLHDGIVWQLHV
jgi:hypothetical protein